jgi:type VI secretion system secreted protein VgrG
MSTITISSAAIDGSPEVVSLQGREGLSDLYHFEIGVRFNGAAFDFEAAINQRASLQIDRGENVPPFEFTGIFASIELLHSFGTSELYRMVIVPELWKLTLTRHSRVFTDNTIVKIIEEVLEEADITGSKVEFRLSKTYRTREFVAMYKESYFEFISRWMEREGMFFYFEHADGLEKLIISDTTGNTKSLATAQSGDIAVVNYVPLSDGSAMPSDALASFRCKSRMLPKRIEMADYNYQKPNLKRLSNGSNVADSEHGHGNIIMYGHNCVDPSDAQAYAEVRSQAHLAAQNVFTGWGQVFDLRSGYPFKLDGHPRFNDDYVVTALEHYCCHLANGFLKNLLEVDSDFAQGDYGCRLTALPKAVAYKTPERTVWPRIEGYEHAIISGEASSDYAQLDDQGRYTIEFYFDESDLVDGKKSCLVRLQQPYGGGHEGFHFNLVKGTEVAVYFAGGDPDRPMICGVAPNPQKQSPTNIHHHTINKITTINDNRIWIEDNSGQQFVYVYCPIEQTYLHFGVELGGFNLILNTEGHVHFNFEGKQVIDISLTLEENVTENVTYNYEENWFVNIKCDHKLIIKEGDLILQVKAGDVDWTVKCDVIWKIDGDVNFLIKGDWNCHDLIGDMNFKIGGDQSIDITGDQNITIGGDQNITITGEQTIDVKSDWKWTVAGHEIKMGWANSTELTAGIKNEAFLGLKNGLHVGIATDVFIGGKAELFIGAKMGIALANELGIFVGTKMELKASDELSIFASSSINIGASLSLNMIGGVEVNLTGGPKMDTYALNMQTGALTVVT